MPLRCGPAATFDFKEHTMAFLLHHFWPGGTEDQYQAMVAVVHPAGGLPKGQTHHVAGPTDGGYLITAVWDSKESADTLRQRRPPRQPARRRRVRGPARGAHRRGLRPPDAVVVGG